MEIGILGEAPGHVIGVLADDLVLVETERGTRV